ncbi:hypothetical protein CVT25_015063 [Psilocybe cyanescens]|uniref:Uncharacterized protein n=1 Tax=Psilocybe cyanescens TaxID=93625 RepID=A0A409WS27_PSICY|nr:hypothetical protein CVT25_015063 [Psilocybe cyanescens]
MSPCSAEKSAISKRHPSPSSSSRENEPFMYCAPPLAIHPTGYIPQLRSKIPCQHLTPSRKPSLIQVGTEFQHFGQTKSSLSHLSDGAQALSTLDVHGSRRPNPTTKITGFTPIIDYQPSSDESLGPKKLVLPPPPRRSSYSSSPWILPGRGDHREEDISYSQTDPSIFEFHNHLLQRMENRDSSRFKPVHTCL